MCAAPGGVGPSAGPPRVPGGRSGLRVVAVRGVLARISGTAPLRAVAALLGVAMFATGVVAVFATENGTGAAALLAIGAAFVVFGALGERIPSRSKALLAMQKVEGSNPFSRFPTVFRSTTGIRAARRSLPTLLQPVDLVDCGPRCLNPGFRALVVSILVSNVRFGLVGEPHQPPDQLLVDALALHHLGVHVRREARVGVAELSHHPARVAPGREREAGERPPHRVWGHLLWEKHLPPAARFSFAR
jgi:hypothetical protein